MTLLHRLAAVALCLLVVLDELFSVLIRLPIYLFTGHNLPCAHETISAWVGQSARLRQPWAITVAKGLDAVLGRGHCAGADAYERSVETPC